MSPRVAFHAIPLADHAERDPRLFFCFHEAVAAYAKLSLSRLSDINDLAALFERLAKDCRTGDATAAMIVVPSAVRFTMEDAADALVVLSRHCAAGFRVAWVAPERETFEQLVRSESAALRYGLTARAFFDETNAVRWLSGK